LADSIFWRKADAAPPPRKSKTGLKGERIIVVFEPVGGEDRGEAKSVWSNGEAVAAIEGLVWDELLPKVRGGGTVRVCGRATGGVIPRDDGEAGIGSFVKGDVGMERCDSSEWRTDGGSSVGMGGGTVGSVWADDLDIFDEIDRRE